MRGVTVQVQSGPESPEHGTIEERLAEAAAVARSYCRSRIRTLFDPAAAVDDVVQETMIAVAAGLVGPNPPHGPLAVYVRAIARHKIVDAYRSAGRARTLATGEDFADRRSAEPGPLELALRRETAGEARALLATLPDRWSLILRLRLMEGRPAAEVAALLGTTPGAVRVTQHRALSHLRAALGSARPGLRDPPAGDPSAVDLAPGDPAVDVRAASA